MFKKITHNPSPAVIGVTNGVYQLEFYYKDLKKNKNYKEIERLLLTSNIDTFFKNQHTTIPNLKIDYLKGTLLKKAKLTDIMVFSPFLFGYKYVVSQKFVDCLIKGKVSQNEYHLRKIIIDNVKTDYYLFFIPIIPSSEIDFLNSILYPEVDHLSDKKRYYSFANYDEYLKYRDKHLFNRWKKISLKDTYKNKSILHLQLNSGIYFSDKLINILVENNISNLVVKDKNILSFSSDSAK